MPPLSISEAINVVTGIVTIAGVIWGVRNAVAALEIKVGESLRQLNAMHRRIDTLAIDMNDMKLVQAVLKERVANLKNTQRFRAPADDTLPLGAE